MISLSLDRCDDADSDLVLRRVVMQSDCVIDIRKDRSDTCLTASVSSSSTYTHFTFNIHSARIVAFIDLVQTARSVRYTEITNVRVQKYESHSAVVLPWVCRLKWPDYFT
jgi:hypothetical protein